MDVPPKIRFGTTRPADERHFPQEGTSQPQDEGRFVVDVTAPFPRARLIRWVPRGSASEPRYPVLIAQTVMEAVDSAVSASLDYEIGGFLLGNRYRCPNESIDYLVIDQYAPARFTEETAVELMFTAETFFELMDDLGGKFRGKELIGWYHSHPRMDVFLSRTDVDLHQARFQHPWQVALVITPDKRKGGLFVWHDGRLDMQRGVEFYEFLEGKAPTTRESVMNWVGYDGYERPAGAAEDVLRGPSPGTIAMPLALPLSPPPVAAPAPAPPPPGLPAIRPAERDVVELVAPLDAIRGTLRERADTAAVAQAAQPPAQPSQANEGDYPVAESGASKGWLLICYAGLAAAAIVGGMMYAKSESGSALVIKVGCFVSESRCTTPANPMVLIPSPRLEGAPAPPLPLALEPQFEFAASQPSIDLVRRDAKLVIVVKAERLRPDAPVSVTIDSQNAQVSIRPNTQDLTATVPLSALKDKLKEAIGAAEPKFTVLAKLTLAASDAGGVQTGRQSAQASITVQLSKVSVQFRVEPAAKGATLVYAVPSDLPELVDMKLQLDSKTKVDIKRENNALVAKLSGMPQAGEHKAKLIGQSGLLDGVELGFATFIVARASNVTPTLTNTVTGPKGVLTHDGQSQQGKKPDQGQSKGTNPVAGQSTDAKLDAGQAKDLKDSGRPTDPPKPEPETPKDLPPSQPAAPASEVHAPRAPAATTAAPPVRSGPTPAAAPAASTPKQSSDAHLRKVLDAESPADRRLANPIDALESLIADARACNGKQIDRCLQKIAFDARVELRKRFLSAPAEKDLQRWERVDFSSAEKKNSSLSWS